MDKRQVKVLTDAIEQQLSHWSHANDLYDNDSVKKINHLRIAINSLVDKMLLRDVEYIGLQEVEKIKVKSDNIDMVNHPSHYNQFSVEVKDTIKEWVNGYDNVFAAYCLGNTLKYISRAPYKNNTLEDLQKARFYIDEAISELEKEN